MSLYPVLPRAALWLLLTPAVAFANTSATWSVSLYWAAPGSSALIVVALDVDGSPVSGTATIDASGWPHVQLPPEGSQFGGHHGICRIGPGGTIVATLEAEDTDGAFVGAYCQILVRIADDAPSTTVAIGFESLSCVAADAQPVACTSRPGTLFIDGPPTIAERSFLLVPQAPPAGPSTAAIVAFLAAGPSSPPPLRLLASPRPLAVRGNWHDTHERAQVNFRLANRAVTSLLNQLYLTYPSIAERDTALAAARGDAAVAAVFPEGQLPYLYLFPEHPRAGQPLALHFLTGVCESFRTDDPDDREVEVSGSAVDVYVPTDNDNICGVPPPGSIPHMLNLPALDAGEYTLRVLARPYDPGEVPESRYTLQFTVLAGNAIAVPDPRVIPGPSSGWLVMLALGLGLAAWTRVRR